jgi:hypothetical protein
MLSVEEEVLSMLNFSVSEKVEIRASFSSWLFHGSDDLNLVWLGLIIDKFESGFFKTVSIKGDLAILLRNLSGKSWSKHEFVSWIARLLIMSVAFGAFNIIWLFEFTLSFHNLSDRI